MSSSTELEFSFSYMSSLTVVVGNGNVAEALRIPANDRTVFYCAEAMTTMKDKLVTEELSRFDLAILNLMIDRQEQHEENRRQLEEKYRASGQELPDPEYTGVMLEIRHFR